MDEPRLFIAAASITVGLVAIGFSFIRRRFDQLLSFFAWFAVLYGARLWMKSAVLGLMRHPSLFLDKLQMAIAFLVAVPAFLFFAATGLIGRTGRVIAYIVCILEMCLIAAIFVGFAPDLLNGLNSIAIIVALVSSCILTFRRRMVEKDEAVFRAGLVIFSAFVLWTNAAALLGHRTEIELYGFAVFLCCLGYVAARRALDRDQQLSSIQQELEVARRIQLSILPAAFAGSEHFTVVSRFVPMASVAGDFYEFIYTGSGTVGLLIADVSGHGIPAALIASMVKVAINSQRHHATDPDRLLAGVNEALCGNAQNQFVTAAYVHLDAGCGRFCYGAAGHPPMLMLRDEQVFSIEENGLVLAVLCSAVYTSTKQPLRRGDRFLLYTDGIIEAANAGGEEFGNERVVNLLQASAKMAPEEAADLIVNTVSGWSSSQSDDLTVIVCDYQRTASAGGVQ
ncbi:MAG: PP2C family protein-serine/threonine phosphatase [Acidobacteriaceae bacterium]